MMIPNDLSRLARDSTRLLNEIIKFNPSSTDKDNLKLKVDILERIVQMIRFEINHTKTDLSIDQLLEMPIFIDDIDRYIHVDLSRQNEKRIASTQVRIRVPYNLQASLLVFLLLNFRRHDSIIHVIEGFVEEIRPSLSIKDFETTQTGAIRCFTNTRFAAKQLRDFGLLKFTKEEAYKRWELSFLGILVASQLYEEHWRDSPSDKVTKVPLDGRILEALSRLHDLKLVRKIFYVLCEDNDLFPAFGDMQKAFKGLAESANAYLSSNAPKGTLLQDAKAFASKLLAQLEKEPSLETFMENLATYTRIKESLQPIRQMLKS